MTAGHRATVGRRQELELIDDLLASPGDGIGGLCVIQGEPSIGKSQLVAELCTRATAADVGVRIGYGEPVNRGRPLHLFGHLLDPPSRASLRSDVRLGGLALLLSDRHQLQEAVIAAIERRPAVVSGAAVVTARPIR